MLIKVMKRVIYAVLIIYSLNLLVMNIGVFVPINYFTIGTVSLLGFPGLISLAMGFFFLL